MSDERMRGHKMLCEVFKSSRMDGMYLYVDKRHGLVDVPEGLFEHFGKPHSAMTLILTPNRTLSRAKAMDVMAIIHEKGYYLQMPPAKEDYLLDLYRPPTQARD